MSESSSRYCSLLLPASPTGFINSEHSDRLPFDKQFIMENSMILKPWLEWQFQTAWKDAITQ